MSDVALASPSLHRLRQVVAAQGEALAPAVRLPRGEEVIGPLTAAGARGHTDAEERALVLESVLEGYLLHYGHPRLIATDDEDLRLLAGDYMYALGLSRLARLGDLVAVRALADLITLCARHHASAGAGSARSDVLTALWSLTALAVSGGSWPEYEQAVAAAHADRAQPAHLRAAVTRRAAELGVEQEAQRALIAFPRVASTEPQT
jgi:hypothetical protein